MEMPGADRASWDRRMSRLDLDVFFLGTAMEKLSFDRPEPVLSVLSGENTGDSLR
jgi:hypothetical protein